MYIMVPVYTESTAPLDLTWSGLERSNLMQVLKAYLVKKLLHLDHILLFKFNRKSHMGILTLPLHDLTLSDLESSISNLDR